MVTQEHPHSRTLARRRRWLTVQAWCAVTLPVGLYLYANLATAHGDVTMTLAGIACPLMFCLAVHIEAERTRPTSRAVRGAQALLTAVVLVCTGLWSWVHLVQLVTESGVPLWQAVAMPVLIDSLLLTALIVLHQQRGDEWAEGEAVEEGLRLTIADDTVQVITNELGVTVQQENDLTTVYQLLSQDEELLYVGITSNLEARMRTHRRRPWWDEVAEMVVRTYPTRTAALAVEEHLITTHWPLHNKLPGSLSDHNTHGVPAARATAPERRVVNSSPRLRAVTDDLDGLSRDELREVARVAGVAVRGSRAEVAARVRAARAAVTPVTPQITDGTAS